MDTNFADLSGSRVDGRIAVTDDLVNLGLHELVAALTKASPAAKADAPANAPENTPTPYASDPAPKSATPDPKALLRKLQVEKLQYRTESGRTILEIACAVEK
ncbi:hypothetical protein [Neolewinella xylanilytica]|nr:hypothetical protein [Neolewinella xylanilytica]